MKKIFILIPCGLFFLSCSQTKNAGKISTVENNNSQVLQTNSSNKMLQDGVDFFAQGNQPDNWQLTINYDDTVRFKTDDGVALNFAYNQLKKETGTESTTYKVSLKSGMVAITILDKICTVSTIREVFQKEVTVRFNSKTYSGCGKFLADENLNHKWILEKIGYRLIDVNEYNKIPSFEFNVSQGKVSGNDGCNSIGGKIEVQGKRIQFSNLFSTKMACNNKSIEKIIAAQIDGKIVSYYFKEGKLFLYLPDDSLLVFKKEVSK